MITIFNRQLVASTNNIEKLTEYRHKLAAADIDYLIKSKDRMSPSAFSSGSRARMGTFAQDSLQLVTHNIYVKTSDYGKSMAVIKGRN